MTGFTATAAPPEQATDAVVGNDSFWPDITADKLRDACRLDGTVSTQRLAHALINALVEVNRQLEDLQAQAILDGFETLADMPAKQVAGTSAKVHHYTQAVYATVQVALTEKSRAVDTVVSTTHEGSRMQLMADVVAEYRRTAHNALNDLRGQRRATVDLL